MLANFALAPKSKGIKKDKTNVYGGKLMPVPMRVRSQLPADTAYQQAKSVARTVDFVKQSDFTSLALDTLPEKYLNILEEAHPDPAPHRRENFMIIRWNKFGTDWSLELVRQDSVDFKYKATKYFRWKAVGTPKGIALRPDVNWAEPLFKSEVLKDITDPEFTEWLYSAIASNGDNLDAVDNDGNFRVPGQFYPRNEDRVEPGRLRPAQSEEVV